MRNEGFQKDGIYKITVANNKTFNVYCEFRDKIGAYNFVIFVCLLFYLSELFFLKVGLYCNVDLTEVWTFIKTGILTSTVSGTSLATASSGLVLRICMI